MKKIRPLKDFRWTFKMPVFEEGTSYEVKDEIADQMVELGYAGYVKEASYKKKQVEKTEKLQVEEENKMMKPAAKENKSVAKKKVKKTKKSK